MLCYLILAAILSAVAANITSIKLSAKMLQLSLIAAAAADKKRFKFSDKLKNCRVLQITAP